MNSASRTNGVLVFLLISFGVTWAWEFTARLLLGLSLVSPLVQPPVAFVPAIAAVIVRRWVTREGFGDAGLALRLRAGWRYYLAAWMLPWAFVAVAVGLAAPPAWLPRCGRGSVNRPSRRGRCCFCWWPGFRSSRPSTGARSSAVAARLRFCFL
jgi:hypothetical protein